MADSKISRVVALLYLSLTGAALLFPRPHIAVNPSGNIFLNLLYKILFLSGPLEIVGNFLLFIPILLVLSHLAPRIQVHYLAFFCILGSATVETMQIWIPGRVSSVRDFISNSIGVVTVTSIMKLNPRFSLWIRGIQ